MFEIPVLLIVFNRASTTARMFEKIADLQPQKLYVSADGPRNEEEAEKCHEVRNITENIGWTCDRKQQYFAENQGGALGPKKAIDWFFENEEMGIIIEDDILPSIDFFNFAKELLIKYKDEKKVMHISSMNFHFGKNYTNTSYYFSKIISPWGWATWKRAWQQYDGSLDDLEEVLPKLEIPDYYKKELINSKNKRVNTWDYQWLYTVLKQHGLGICPSNNLAINIGYGDEGTRTHNAPKWTQRIKIEKIGLLKHPELLEYNTFADDITYNEIIPEYKLSFLSKLKKLYYKF